MEKEQEIVNFLREKYRPQAILLFGSRMDGTAKSDSDWDLFVIEATEGDKISGLLTYKTELLDVTFKEFPDTNEPLTTAIKPLWPVKVLLDDSNGRMEQVLSINREALKKGPMFLYKEGINRRFNVLLRRQTKIKKYENAMEAQLIFAGAFLESAVRLWFELQNEWPMPVDKAMPIISKRDSRFGALLNDLCENNTQKRISLSEELVQKLRDLQRQ